MRFPGAQASLVLVLCSAVMGVMLGSAGYPEISNQIPATTHPRTAMTAITPAIVSVLSQMLVGVGVHISIIPLAMM